VSGDDGGNPPIHPNGSPAEGDDAPIEVERGRRYTLSVGDETYDIVDREAAGGPVASFSGDEAGMEAALREFGRLEGTRNGPGVVLSVLPYIFGIAVVTWILTSALTTIEYARISTGDSILTDQPPHWIAWVGAASTIAFTVWIAAAISLGVAYLLPRVTTRP
jgi:hypothetical protein